MQHYYLCCYLHLLCVCVFFLLGDDDKRPILMLFQLTSFVLNFIDAKICGKNVPFEFNQCTLNCWPKATGKPSIIRVMSRVYLSSRHS